MVPGPSEPWLPAAAWLKPAVRSQVADTASSDDRRTLCKPRLIAPNVVAHRLYRAPQSALKTFREMDVWFWLGQAEAGDGGVNLVSVELFACGHSSSCLRSSARPS